MEQISIFEDKQINIWDLKEKLYIEEFININIWELSDSEVIR